MCGIYIEDMYANRESFKSKRGTADSLIMQSKDTAKILQTSAKIHVMDDVYPQPVPLPMLGHLISVSAQSFGWLGRRAISTKSMILGVVVPGNSENLIEGGGYFLALL